MARRRILLFSVMFILVAGLPSCGGGRRFWDERSPRLRATFPGAMAPRDVSLTEVTLALERLSKPDYVDNELFESLKKGLIQGLTRRGLSKFSMTPPNSPAGKVDDLSVIDNSDGTISLAWTYRNLGDYNQDGTVDIGDISILAEHFFDAFVEPEGWPHPVDEVIDGDGSKILDIADIVPLAENFFNNVAGYTVLGSATPEGEFSPFLDVPLSVATGDGFKRFTTHPISSPPAYVKVRPYDFGGNLGIASDPVSTALNQRPEILSVTPTSGQAGTVVEFRATVVGTPPFEYLWDFGGGAIPNWSNDASPQVTLVGTAGIYDASLRVDNEFGFDVFPFQLEVIAEPVLELFLGEVRDLGTISQETSWLLSTAEDEEYALVLVSPAKINEPTVPGEFTVTVSYSDRTASKVPASLAVDLTEEFRKYQLANANSYGDILPREALMRLAKQFPLTKPRVRRRASTIGETRSFNISWSPLNPAPVDATLREEASLCELWVDDRVPISDEENGIPATFLMQIRDYLNSRVIPLETSTYGAMYDPDEDGKLLVLFTLEINRVPGSVGGYFTEVDFFPDTFPDKSNNADVVYIQVPDPTGAYDAGNPVTQNDFRESAVSIIAHELQHLLNSSNRLRFSQATQTRYTPEEYWLNEALSHFTEDFTGFQSPNNYASPEQFLSTAPLVYLPGGNESNPVPHRRGAGYLFVRYLVDRFGEDILPRILMRDATDRVLTGWDNLESAIGESLDSVLLAWAMAMELSTVGVSPLDPIYSYAPTTTDPVTQAQHGISFNDWNSTFSGSSYAVTGPLVFPLSPDSQNSYTYTAKVNTPLFFRLSSLSPRASARLTITPEAGKPISALLARIDTGKTSLEGEVTLVNDTLVLSRFESAGEVDLHPFTVNDNFAVIRLTAISPTIDNFQLSVEGNEYPNSAFHPFNMPNSPPGIFNTRIFFGGRADVMLEVASLNGASGYYALEVFDFGGIP
mgnify:CR=1 FL=1